MEKLRMHETGLVEFGSKIDLIIWRRYQPILTVE